MVEINGKQIRILREKSWRCYKFRVKANGPELCNRNYTAKFECKKIYVKYQRRCRKPQICFVTGINIDYFSFIHKLQAVVARILYEKVWIENRVFNDYSTTVPQLRKGKAMSAYAVTSPETSNKQVRNSYPWGATYGNVIIKFISAYWWRLCGQKKEKNNIDEQSSICRILNR